MAAMGYGRAAARYAWRDMQLSRARPAFLLAAMAVSVASIGGVRSAANVARSALDRQSRSWLGGDLAVTTGDPLEPEQIQALDRLRAKGIEWTLVTTSLTMGASSQSPDPSVIAIKAVDPAHYPLYGALTIQPPEALSTALGPHAAVVSQDALARFHLHLGGDLQLGAARFRVTAVIQAEPDRFSGVSALGVRCLLSHEGMEGSGIARSGDSLKWRVLLRLPAGTDAAPVLNRLRELFPEARLSGYREANRDAQSTLETTALFLNLTAFVALALGALGMAMAVRQHIGERAQTLAVMKTVGGRNRQLTGIFFLQIAGLAGIALALGVPLGWGVRAAILWLVSQYVVLPRPPLVDYAAVLDTVAAGFGALVPTLAATALAIRSLRPALLLRHGWEAPLPRSKSLLGLAWAVPAAILSAIAVRLLGSWNLAAILLASLMGSVALAFLLAQVLLQLLRRWTSSFAPGRRVALWRHALANLYRAGGRGQALIVALAVGCMMMVATFQINRAVTQSILGTLPFDHPDLIVPAIETGLRAEVPAFLAHLPGVSAVEVGTQARGRMTIMDSDSSVAGLVGCAAGLQGASRLPAPTVVAEDIAREFHLRVGSQLQFRDRHQVIPATVTLIRPMTRIEEVWYKVRMDCSDVDRSSLFYQVAVRIRPGRIAEVRRAFLAVYPAIEVFTADDLTEVVGQASHDAVLLARWLAWYAIGSSLAVLAAMVSASSASRLREMAILSALGAPPRTMVKLYTIEFAAIGVLSGSIGSILAYGFTAVAVSAILRGVHAPADWRSLMVATLAAGVLSVAAGWLPAYRLLRRKPLEVLRVE